MVEGMDEMNKGKIYFIKASGKLIRILTKKQIRQYMRGMAKRYYELDIKEKEMEIEKVLWRHKRDDRKDMIIIRCPSRNLTFQIEEH